MIETLKSELKLRPTYDEMIGIISKQGDDNRPSIETIIDRRATIFRNNQFGSQFDTVDFLGLKKQEENRIKQEQRDLQLRETAQATGSSVGILSYEDQSPAYINEGFETPNSDEYTISLADVERIRAELREYEQRQQGAKDVVSSVIKRILEKTHSQSIPEGVPVHSIATPSLEPTQVDDDDEMPPLIPLEQEVEAETKEEEEDIKLTPYETGVFSFNNSIGNISKNENITIDGLLFQLFYRDLINYEVIKDIKDRPDENSQRESILNTIEWAIDAEEWQVLGDNNKLKQKSKEWMDIKRKLKQRAQPSSSSSGILDTVVGGAKAVGSAVIGAGKEIAKDALVEGAKTAVMSLL